MTRTKYGRSIAAAMGIFGGGPRPYHAVLVIGTLVAMLGAAPIVTAFLQVPDEPSPESGTAQVVAQGIVDIGAEDLRWQVTERTAEPPANASVVESELGFLIVDSGVVLVDDRESGEQHRLPAGEAALTRAGTEQMRAALGSDAATYRELVLVPADAEAPADGTEQFLSEPFAGLGARHDLDLLQDVLGAGATMAIPSGSLPTLALVLDGAVDLTVESGDVLSLGAGEATALTGPLLFTATENGASIAAVYTGPAVPRLAQAAGTPSAGRVIQTEPDTADEPAATPAATAAAADAATEDTDEDGDGLTEAQEGEAGTDPALADTDEDGLTDGQEAVEFGTDPLASDTDGDGVLDGDEVAQGSDPLDSLAGGAEVPVEEPIPAEDAAPEAVPATPGDSDEDGLEDAIEAELGTDPFDPDTDDDGLTDGDEYYAHATGTRNPDSDGDGIVDGAEIENATDPNDPASA